jgi:hypothetical protein
LLSFTTLIVFGDGETHDNSDDKATKMADVVDVGLGDSDLEIEKKNQKDENDECESLHWIAFSKSLPFDTQI